MVTRVLKQVSNCVGVSLIAMVMFAVPGNAQTVSLPAADATLRSGVYTDVNDGIGDLKTEAATDASNVRRALLKFDTHTTIPAGSPIISAKLTVTVKGGSLGTRRIAAYCVPSSFDEFQTTWRLRKGTLYWSTPGGDARHQHAVVGVTNVAGSRVTFDVTQVTQEAMMTSSRYTRVLLVDIDSPSTSSYKEYYSNEATSGLRPQLVVNFGSGTGGSTATLRVLQWNIAQGWGTDGKSNLDRVVDWVVKMKPDVISFNEIEHYASPTADDIKIIADKLTARTGQTWAYKWIQKWGAAEGEGEAVMSRLPFTATATHLLSYSRSVAEATVIVNGRTINVASTHLDAYTSSYRLAEIAELKPWLGTFAEQRIVAGDFNSQAGTTEINEMTKEYRDGWADAVKAGTAVAYPDNPYGNTRKSRIDFVFYSTGATYLVLKGAQVYDTRDAYGVRPSDHNPLVATFEVR